MRSPRARSNHARHDNHDHRRRQPRRDGCTTPRERRDVVLAAKDESRAHATAATTAERLVRAAGFEPVSLGGLAEMGRMEGPSGDLQGRVLDLDGAHAALTTEVTT